MVITSPGRYAEPEIMFSAIAIRPDAMPGAPDLSDFIPHRPWAGLPASPPVSNVMPLPTSATLVLAPFGPYRSTTSRGGASEPMPTARMPPYPPFLRNFSSGTSTPKPAWPAPSPTPAPNHGGGAGWGARLTPARGR